FATEKWGVKKPRVSEIPPVLLCTRCITREVAFCHKVLEWSYGTSVTRRYVKHPAALPPRPNELLHARMNWQLFPDSPEEVYRRYLDLCRERLERLAPGSQQQTFWKPRWDPLVEFVPIDDADDLTV